MLIDWFTVVAQALNFLILVWLLKRYLYQPVLDAIDAREQRIAKELQQAAHQQAQAEEQRVEFTQKNADLQAQRETLLSKARDDAKTERQRLLDQAQEDADALSAKRHHALDDELTAMQGEIAQRTQTEAFAIAQKVLTELAETTLEARMVAVFVQRLQTLEAQPKEALREALQGPQTGVVIRSAFALTTDQRDAIVQALRQSLETTVAITFETVPTLVSGIALHLNGWKLAWSVRDALSALQSAEADSDRAKQESLHE